MRITLPESVHRYATDGRIRSAVGLLLGGKSPKMPDELLWDEVQDFYRACLAAQQTRIEWAMALDLLWTAVFADQVEDWRPSSIRRQAEDSGLRIDVQHLWENDEFTRDLVRGEHYLEGLVELDADEGVRVAVCLYADGEPVEMATPAGMHRVDEWLYSPWQPFAKTADLDITALRRAARSGVAAANDAFNLAT